MDLEQEILTEYNLNVQEVKLLRHNENMTYKVLFYPKQYEMICSQGWFTEALHYWDEEVFQKIVRGERIEQEIGLYS